MTKKEILQGLQERGMDFVYEHFQELTEDEKRELVLSAIYVLSDNKLMNRYIEELDSDLLD